MTTDGTLERASQLLAAKRRIFARYAADLAGVDGVQFQRQASWASATRWLATIVIDPDVTRTTGARLRAMLSSHSIQVGPPWAPLHLTAAHRGCAPWPCPVAERLGRDAFHLPSSPTLTSDQQDRVLAAIHAITGQPART